MRFITMMGTAALTMTAASHAQSILINEVRTGSAELGVAWDAVDARGLHATPYRRDHLQVIVPPSHPLAGRTRVNFADTLDHPSVALAGAGLVGRIMQREAALLALRAAARADDAAVAALLRAAASARD